MSILKRKKQEVKEAVLSCLQLVNQWQSGSKYVLCLVNSIPIRLPSSFFENREHSFIVLVCCGSTAQAKATRGGKSLFQLTVVAHDEGKSGQEPLGRN